VATLAVSAVGIDRPGIIAPQIGELVRIVVVDCSPHPQGGTHHGELVLVNPVIVAASGSEIGARAA
jgi:peptide deformylase